ncbi:MAG: bifunctional diaminohydroxyphosphoribosylaminopyrimidine deaminase/5-amino-6-(5-phosphoribosylamino)uracil reductase RibD, partial [Steroidobacteraceae bacterium]|nr:bifunctional diaminohydroxyphosphoribosylaminopyrimidine deaminase/5-amino-6-(5-phosphoribosylamino)uracil reductase RibD [Steroidobacteraceae bacterium]
DVVYALDDPDPRVDGRGRDRLRAAGIRVRHGLCAVQAADLNIGFIYRLRRGRPFVRVKLACSLDGRTALASGASHWISGEAARADVQHWRARSGAILTGIGTVLADDPQLTVRSGSPSVQPLRVVLDSRLRVPRSARVLGQDGRALLFARREAVGADIADAARAALQRDGIGLEWLDGPGPGLDLRRVLAYLARERAINELLVEAGPTLTGALLQADLVDELLLYMAPMLLGDDAKPLAHLPALTSLPAAPRFALEELAIVGGDLRIRLRPPQRTAES